MTEYRILPMTTPGEGGQPQLGLVVGKGDRIRMVGLSDADAWNIALGLLRQLQRRQVNP